MTEGEVCEGHAHAPNWKWCWLAPGTWITGLIAGIAQAFMSTAAEVDSDVRAAYNHQRGQTEFLDDVREDIERIRDG